MLNSTEHELYHIHKCYNAVEANIIHPDQTAPLRALLHLEQSDLGKVHKQMREQRTVILNGKIKVNKNCVSFVTFCQTFEV